MHRVLRPGGRLAVAVWKSIEHQTSFAAIYAVLLACLPREKAEPYAAPFSWPRADELAAAIRAAGFSNVHVQEHRLPLIFEEGAEQALAALAASPIATTINEMTTDERRRLWQLGRERLMPLVSGRALRAELVSNIATATR